MKKILLLSMILFNFLSNGKTVYKPQWKVILFNDLYYLENIHEPNLRTKIMTMNNIPKFMNVTSKLNNRVQLLVYLAGSSGTSVEVKEIRASIYDTKNKVFLGDFPYQYKMTNKKGFPQPKWVFKNSSIHISDIQTGLSKLIKLP